MGHLDEQNIIQYELKNKGFRQQKTDRVRETALKALVVRLISSIAKVAHISNPFGYPKVSVHAPALDLVDDAGGTKAVSKIMRTTANRCKERMLDSWAKSVNEIREILDTTKPIPSQMTTDLAKFVLSLAYGASVDYSQEWVHLYAVLFLEANLAFDEQEADWRGKVWSQFLGKIATQSLPEMGSLLICREFGAACQKGAGNSRYMKFARIHKRGDIDLLQGSMIRRPWGI